MLEFKKEYFQTETNRHLYPTTLNISKCEVYGCKEREAFVYKIPNDRYASNAGNIDFSLYPNGVWSDYTAIKIVEKLPYFQPSVNFNKLGDITASNLNKLKDEIKKHIVDLETAITESYVFIDSGSAGQNNLPYLPEGCVWFRDPIIKDVIALPISDLYGKFNQMVEEIRNAIKDLINQDISDETKKLLEKLRTETDKLLEELNQASAGLPNRVTALENKTTQNRKELEDLINTSRTENIQPSRIVDNSISSSKLKIATDEDKIKLVNLSDEVKKAMAGNTPVSPTLQKDSVVREYIADEAVNASKIDNSMFHKEYLVNIKSTNGIVINTNSLSLKSGDKIEVIWFAKEKKNNGLTFVHSSGIFHKSLTNVTELVDIFKHHLSFELEFNITLRNIKISNRGSGSTVTFNGSYYDFIIKVNGKNIDFTFGNTSEEISLVNVCEKSAIDYETALNLVNSKKPVLSEFSDEDKMLILGKATDEYEVCIEKLKSIQNFIKNKIAIPNIRLKAGKYKILPYAINRNFIIYAFPTARGGKILQKFELNKFTSEGIEIILTNDSYVGIQEKDNSGNGVYWFGVGTTYKTNFFSTTTTHEVGEVLLVNEGDGAISPRDSYTCPLQFELTKISSLTTNSNSQEIEDIKKIYTDKLNNIASFDINNIPSENKQILYRIEDLKDILYNDDFIYSKNINNVMTDSSIFIHTPYQAIDEFTYRVKFKLNNVNSKFGITAYKGEYENGAWMIDTANKTLNFVSAVSPTFVQNLNLDYQFEDRIGYSDFPTILNIEGIEFQENSIYILEIVRSGLIMTLNIYDIKNDKTFSKKIPNSRFHGGKGVFVQEGEIEIAYVEEKTPLINGAKAIFIGDSISEGLAMGTTDISKRWASLLRDNYFKGNALCCGMGWGTTKNVKQVLENIRSYCNYIKYYFIMIGTNQRSEETHVTWKTEIVEIYDTIRNLGGIPVIIVPPLGRVETANAILFKMRDFILEKGWDTIRMDIATSTGDGITFDNSLSTDGTHFNVNGNQKMYERALIDLKRIM